MKTLLIPSVVVGVLLVGCGDNSSKSGSSTNSSGGSLVTAPVDYLNAAAKSEQRAVKTIDVTSLNKAIEMFNVQEGRFPKDLDELVAMKYMAQIPTPPFGSKIVYDAKTGTAKIEKQ